MVATFHSKLHATFDEQLSNSHAIHNGVNCQARKKAVAVLVLILLESEEKGPIKRRNNHVRVRGSIKGRKWVLVLLPFETG